SDLFGGGLQRRHRRLDVVARIDEIGAEMAVQVDGIFEFDMAHGVFLMVGFPSLASGSRASIGTLLVARHQQGVALVQLFKARAVGKHMEAVALHGTESLLPNLKRVEQVVPVPLGAVMAKGSPPRASSVDQAFLAEHFLGD